MKEKRQSKRKREGKERGESEKFQCELFGICLFWEIIFSKKGLPCLQPPLLLPFVVSPGSRLKAKERLWNELDFWPSKEPSRTLRTPTSGSLETIQAGRHPPTPPTPPPHPTHPAWPLTSTCSPPTVCTQQRFDFY